MLVTSLFTRLTNAPPQIGKEGHLGVRVPQGNTCCIQEETCVRRRCGGEGRIRGRHFRGRSPGVVQETVLLETMKAYEEGL